MGGRYTDHGTCRIGAWVEGWVCAVLIMGVVAGGIIGVTLVDLRGGR